MSKVLILYPVLAHMALVFWLFGLLAVRKRKALAAKTVDLERRALFEDAWPDDVVAVNNSLRNQFQVPLLFYVLSIMLFVTDSVNLWTLSLGVLFVITRYAHALVHTGSNIVLIRFRLFTLGFVITLLMALNVLFALLRFPG